MNNSLNDRVLIVTGGTGRLGNAVTKLLLERGANVIVTYTKESEVAKLQSHLSPVLKKRLTAKQVDVTDQAAVKMFVHEVMTEWKRIDGLANLVGGWQSTPFVELTLADWRKMMDLNLTSAFLMSQAVLPHMVEAKYGRILGVGAQSAIQANKEQANYNVSKVGVMWLMETISHEFKDHGITANAILPSAIKTQAEHDANPDGAWALPEEIAEVVAFLLSPESGVTSGAKVPVYGKS